MRSDRKFRYLPHQRVQSHQKTKTENAADKTLYQSMEYQNFPNISHHNIHDIRFFTFYDRIGKGRFLVSTRRWHDWRTGDVVLRDIFVFTFIFVEERRKKTMSGQEIK
jgi:hypothetical protein